MASNHKIQCVSKALATVLFVIGASGCNEDAQVRAWVDATSAKKETAQSASGQMPYREPQFTALRDYFAELAHMALTLESDPDRAAALNTVLAKMDMREICTKTLISKQTAETIIQRCTRNRFFLCAEEVRSYSVIVAALRAKLNPEQQKRFDDTETCKAALE